MNTSHSPSFRGIVSTLIVLTISFSSSFLTPSAATAKDWVRGDSGNPIDCTNNWTVSKVIALKSRDGVVRAYSQMWWSESCQGNWVRTWTADGDKSVLRSQIFPSGRPTPDRPFALADDYASAHFTMYLRARPKQEMCAATSFNEGGENEALSGVFCAT